MKDWFDVEEFWVDFYDFLFSPSQFEKAEGEITQLLNLVGDVGPDILDLCCGPARHSVLLAQKGYQVTGVDNSNYILRKAKENCRRRQVTVRFVKKDMREYVQPGSYDLILNLYTSFGFFKNQNDDRRVVRNMYNNLKIPGKVVVELMGKEILARVFQETASAVLDDGSIIVQRHKIINNWSEVENEWILLKGGKYKTYRFNLRLYSAVELQILFAACGFQNIKVFGGFNGVKYDNNAQRLVLLAEKVKE